MRVVRAGEGPVFGRFLADAAGRVVLEVYRQDAPVPDYPAQDPFVFHIAFKTADVEAERARLHAAGATAATDVTRSPNGDVMTFLRDPWGVVLQLVRRGTPLL
jgi:hypothetical protein